ncbi:hypothetical protein Hanom_Chr00s006133g01732511 [Helianthus anomalus]
MSCPFPVKISKTTLRVGRDPNSTPWVWSTSLASSGDDTTTRLRCPMRRRNISPNFFARSVKLRWFRSSPTWSQLPKIGTGMGPGGSFSFLPRSLDITIAPIMAANKAIRVFSKRIRSIAADFDFQLPGKLLLFYR